MPVQPPLIQIESARDYLGCTAETGQPSVQVVLRIAHRPAARAALARVDRMWASLPGAAAGVAGANGLAQKIAAVAHAGLQAARQPVFDPPFVAMEGAQRFRLCCGCINGTHRRTRALIGSLVEAANAVYAGSPAAQWTAAVQSALQAFEPAAPRGKNTLGIVRSAYEAGIPWERMFDNLYCLGHGVHARWFDSSLTDRTPGLGATLARNKHAAAMVLRGAGIPVPRHALVGSAEEAVATARALGGAVVVKPADMDQGVGVAAGLRSEQAVRRAYARARAFSTQVLVEAHVEGGDHRIHVFEGEVFRVRHRIPGGITGDGRASVRSLLDALNASPDRGEPGSGADLVRIPLDEEALELLAEQGLDPDAVPAAGRFVPLRRIANVSVGGVSTHVPIERVHPDNLALASRAVRALRLDLAAVDFLIPDITRSWMEVGGGVCEVNARPQFGEDVPPWLLRRMFPSGGRVPVVVAGGTPDWIAEVRATAAARGLALGYADAEGAWIGAQRVAARPAGGAFESARILLNDTGTQALLLRADESLLANGMPADRVDLVVLDALPRDLATLLIPRSLRQVDAIPAEGGAAEVLAILAGQK